MHFMFSFLPVHIKYCLQAYLFGFKNIHGKSWFTNLNHLLKKNSLVIGLIYFSPLGMIIINMIAQNDWMLSRMIVSSWCKGPG